MDFPLLTALVLVPAVGALCVLLLPTRDDANTKVVAGIFSLIVAVLCAYLVSQFKTGEAGYQFVSHHPWIDQLGVSWKLGVDGISLWLVALTGWIFPIAMFGPRENKDTRSYLAMLLILEAGCIGVFLALDLFLFFVFWEVVLIPMYFLIGRWGHGRRVYAATKFFIYTAAGSALMLVAIVTLAVLSSRQSGGLTFDIEAITATGGIAASTSRWLFAAFALSFGIKVPLFPLHTWLPDAHTEAPTAGSVVLAAVMLKLGTYGFVRFGLGLFPRAAFDLAPVLLTLAVIGIIYGALVATVQKDLKRLVAYSSVAHLGFIVMGIFSFTNQGLDGAILQMVNHGLSTGALFLLVGMVYERRHTREISALGGLAKPAPILAGFFMVSMLASVGVPGLNGFVGEFLTLLGTFATRRWWAVVAAGGVILAAIYLLWAYQRVFMGEAKADNAKMPEMTWREAAVIAPLVAGMVFLGLNPKPVVDKMEPSVNLLLERIETVNDYVRPEITVKGPVDVPSGTQPGSGGEH